MKKLLSLFSVLTFSTVSVTSVVACSETETEVGLPVAVASALGFLGAGNVGQKLPTIINNVWSIDLTGVSLASLLNPSNEALNPQCGDFIQNILGIKPDATGKYVKANLVALDQFTEIETVNPILSATANEYDLIGGSFAIQFNSAENTPLGDEFIVPLKTQTNFINTLISGIAANTVTLADVAIDIAKFKVNQPVSGLGLKVDDEITINDTTTGKLFNNIGQVLEQNIKFSVIAINTSTPNFQLSDSITLKLLVGEVVIDSYTVTLHPVA